VAVLGASGYTGAEVVRLSALHPNIKITTLTGDRQAGKVGSGLVLWMSRLGAAHCSIGASDCRS
jgi:N-acetyl-gamma-glutamylphosphate reductase